MSQTDEAAPYVRLMVTMPPALAQRVKHFWHQQELPSNSEAIRHLVRAGFKAIAESERKAAVAAMAEESPL
jgi:metal-responsive CopG/Arc/MetJ family transcriptional regulator